MNLGTVFKVMPRNVTVLNTVIQRGHSGTVSVQLSAQGNEHALAFSLRFDTNLLTFMSATADNLPANAGFVVNKTRLANGDVGFVIELPQGQVFPPGIQPLVQITFAAAPGNATVTTPISFVDQPNASRIADAGSDFDVPARYVNGSVTLTVLAGARSELGDIMTGLNALQGNLPNLTVAQTRKLDLAVRSLGASLNSSYWADENHLKPRGNRALDALISGVHELQCLQQAKSNPALSASLRVFIGRIAACVRLLAETRIEDAANSHTSEQRTQRAQAMMAAGDKMAASGNPVAAIRFYRNAWLQMGPVASTTASFN